MALFVEEPINGVARAARQILFDMSRCDQVIGDEGSPMIGIIDRNAKNMTYHASLNPLKSLISGSIK